MMALACQHVQPVALVGVGHFLAVLELKEGGTAALPRRDQIEDASGQAFALGLVGRPLGALGRVRHREYIDAGADDLCITQESGLAL